MTKSKFKKTRAILTILLMGASLVVAQAAKAGFEIEKPAIKAGDYAVITYRLSNFDPTLLNVRGTRVLVERMANAEIARMNQQDVLLRQVLKTALSDAEHAKSLNPLLRHRGIQAEAKVSSIAADLARNTIELQRMEIMKRAVRGEPLTDLEVQRVRLHEFKTLRSVQDASEVSEMAARSIQKEAALFGAKVTAVEKFSTPAIEQALKLQARMKMRIAGGIGVAVGVAVFVLYSNYEIERTESELGHAVEIPAPAN